MTSCRKILRTCLILMGLLLSFEGSGCGKGASDGPQRYQISGHVNFDGKPLPFGTITFEPDASKGNQGPQGFANIRDGIFDTSGEDGKGGTSGEMIISIIGTTHETVTEGSPGRFLFQEYRIEKTFPKDSYTFDVDIPREAGDLKAKKSR